MVTVVEPEDSVLCGAVVPEEAADDAVFVVDVSAEDDDALPVDAVVVPDGSEDDSAADADVVSVRPSELSAGAVCSETASEVRSEVPVCSVSSAEEAVVCVLS